MCRERKYILVEFVATSGGQVATSGGEVATATLDYFDVMQSSHHKMVEKLQLTSKGIQFMFKVAGAHVYV